MKNSFKTLKTINKRAKLYSRQQDTISEMRSKALYQLKYNAILKWIEHVENTELHYIHNEKYYCFYYDQYSFHIPFDAIQNNIQYQNEKVLHNFESDFSLEQNIYQTEKESLTQLYEKHNLNPNQYLSQNCPFQTYWPYLPM